MEELYGFCFRDFGEFINQTQEMIMGMTLLVKRFNMHHLLFGLTSRVYETVKLEASELVAW